MFVSSQKTDQLPLSHCCTWLSKGSTHWVVSIVLFTEYSACQMKDAWKCYLQTDFPTTIKWRHMLQFCLSPYCITTLTACTISWSPLTMMHSAVAENKLYLKVPFLFDKIWKSVIIFIHLWVIWKMWTGNEKKAWRTENNFTPASGIPTQYNQHSFDPGDPLARSIKQMKLNLAVVVLPHYDGL